MTIAEAADVRKQLIDLKAALDGKQAGVQSLFHEFRMHRQTPLGAHTDQVAIVLHQAKQKLDAVDEAIGSTDVHAATQAIQGLEALQLALLQLEQTTHDLVTPQSFDR
ncbi:MAG: hypothetical protein FJ318_02265 [SAR202 cluster bacterium]|nr:hypothetical protein [SAR202 cluster bacterium]